MEIAYPPLRNRALRVGPKNAYGSRRITFSVVWQSIICCPVSHDVCRAAEKFLSFIIFDWRAQRHWLEGSECKRVLKHRVRILGGSQPKNNGYRFWRVFSQDFIRFRWHRNPPHDIFAWFLVVIKKVQKIFMATVVVVSVFLKFCS